MGTIAPSEPCTGFPAAACQGGAHYQLLKALRDARQAGESDNPEVVVH